MYFTCSAIVHRFYCTTDSASSPSFWWFYINKMGLVAETQFSRRPCLNFGVFHAWVLRVSSRYFFNIPSEVFQTPLCGYFAIQNPSILSTEVNSFGKNGSRHFFEQMSMIDTLILMIIYLLYFLRTEGM